MMGDQGILPKTDVKKWFSPDFTEALARVRRRGYFGMDFAQGPGRTVEMCAEMLPDGMFDIFGELVLPVLPCGLPVELKEVASWQTS